MAQLISGPLGLTGTPGSPAPRPLPPRAIEGPVVVGESSGRTGLVIGVALVLIAVAAAVFLFAR